MKIISWLLGIVCLGILFSYPLGSTNVASREITVEGHLENVEATLPSAPPTEEEDKVTESAKSGPDTISKLGAFGILLVLCG